VRALANHRAQAGGSAADTSASHACVHARLHECSSWDPKRTCMGMNMGAIMPLPPLFMPGIAPPWPAPLPSALPASSSCAWCVSNVSKKRSSRACRARVHAHFTAHALARPRVRASIAAHALTATRSAIYSAMHSGHALRQCTRAMRSSVASGGYAPPPRRRCQQQGQEKSSGTRRANVLSHTRVQEGLQAQRLSARASLPHYMTWHTPCCAQYP
jgi:hypothetical protein